MFVRRRSTWFYYDAMVTTLYHRSYDGILLRCLSNSEAQEVIKEAYDGINGAHQSGLKLMDWLHPLGYWPTMIANAVEYAKRCKICQIHADFIHQPPELLHPTVASWPFEAWVIDIIGLISPPSVKGHQFILAITDCFSKWTEAVPLVEVKTTNVVNFIRQNVIHQFGVPRRITHDNGPQFASQSFYWFATSTRFKMWRQLLTTLPLMDWQKHSTRRSSSFSKSSSPQANEIGMRNLVNVFGLIRLQSKPQQEIHLFLWYTDVKQLYLLRFQYRHFVLFWQPR